MKNHCRCLTKSYLLRRHRSGSAENVQKDVEMKDLDSGDKDKRPVYYIEKILEVKRDRKKAGQALIKWIGHSESECTWEPIGIDLGHSCK